MSKTKKWIKGILSSTIVVFCLTITLALTFPSNHYFAIVKNLEIFANLFKAVNEYYVDDINPSQLLNKGIEEMLAELDPYTVYISEDKIEDYRTLNTGQYAGIGATTVNIDGHIFIGMVYEGFSAHKEGLKIGDEVVKVDGVNIFGLSQQRLNQLVKGQVKTTVTIAVRRKKQKELIALKFEREKISIPNVPYSGMLDSEIGYIKFTEFTPNGYKNVKKALQGLLKDGATGIVLDLRGNLGGLLKEAVNISNLFLDANLEVVHTKGKVESSNFTYKTEFNPLAPEIPLVVLVNKMSASASEIVAGTLQDYDRAVLIGQKTYGKGLVQKQLVLPYNSSAKITIAKYYIPSGRCIQALDYSNRNADGSVGTIPDSLKVAFTTKKGRIVFDGGGIDPEVTIINDNESNLAKDLKAKGYIFKYATDYTLAHKQIAPAKEYNFTDDDYIDFISWLQVQDYNYVNPLSKNLKDLQNSAKSPKQTEQLKPFISEMGSKLNMPLTTALHNYSNEIKRMLEVEIAARYYFESGAVEAGLGHDPHIEKAIQILKDKEAYEKLLLPNQN